PGVETDKGVEDASLVKSARIHSEESVETASRVVDACLITNEAVALAGSVVLTGDTPEKSVVVGDNRCVARSVVQPSFETHECVVVLGRVVAARDVSEE